MTERPSDRAIAHLARVAVSHLDDGANCNITPGLNAALRRLREELDKTNAGYAAAPDGAQAVAWRITGRFGKVTYTGDKEDAELLDAHPQFNVMPLFEHPNAAEGAQPIALWCLHLQGPDEVIPAPTQAHAQKAADAINAYDDTGLVRAIAAPWPHSDQSHADDVGKFITEWMIPRGALAMEQASREFGTTPPQPQDADDAARFRWFAAAMIERDGSKRAALKAQRFPHDLDGYRRSIDAARAAQPEGLTDG